MEEVRLQKFMAEAGVASRRKCEEEIVSGKVFVNGKQITTLGTKINPRKDIVEVEGLTIHPRHDYIYLMMNKPTGVITTTKEPFGRKTVLDFLKGVKQRVVPVGRLDKDTSGLLLLSNDGDFVYHMTHPKHEIDKTYIATVKGLVSKEEIRKLQQGVTIQDYKTKPAKVRVLDLDTIEGTSCLEIIIHEGKNRQVRKMCQAIGHKVITLHRSQIGRVCLGNLEKGKWRVLTKAEIEKLRK